MGIPTATYRLQFRNGMTFDRAITLIPYMKSLGISHLYASPIFTATRESTHGYDATRADEIELTIGGRAGFDRLACALKAAGLGLILDIVPNHMASSLENPWWHDVLLQGEKSAWAYHFDIDWSRPLTLPFLGDNFENEAEAGNLTVDRDPQSGHPALHYHGLYYPLTPASWQGKETDVLALTGNALIPLHQQQPWRLMHWSEASKQLSYRRFFEVAELVGMRVEDPQVFADTHQLIIELVKSGAVDGLRIDHIDGLADPLGYLKNLRAAVGEACYITVEKILSEGESLPEEWPVSGTTGYEFIASLAEVLVDDNGIDRLRDAWLEATGASENHRQNLLEARTLMVDRNFYGEFNRLVDMGNRIATGQHSGVDSASLQEALRALLLAFPVYRTYGTEAGLPESDRERLEQVMSKVRQQEGFQHADALGFIQDLLHGDITAPLVDEFRTRFQQLTGPLMAKSVEDTLFFRENLDLALNEVGAEPAKLDFALTRFHQDMKQRLQQQPAGLTSTSTHDTKRGEDARARLYVLSEAPELWASHLARWRQMNQTEVKFLEDGTAPRNADTWMIYQALAGVWPANLQPNDATGLAALSQRFGQFLEKALREAKLRTDWIAANTPYEEAVLHYGQHLLDVKNQDFLQDFQQSLAPFIRAGLINSLTQTVLKLLAPGVPDIYQGSEALNFSLVDPDNRREPDFKQLEQWLTHANGLDFSNREQWLNGAVNQLVTAKLLHLRQQNPALFLHGEYFPLMASGKWEEHVLAFARIWQDHAVIVVVPRTVFQPTNLHFTGLLSEEGEQTYLPLMDKLANRHYCNVLTGCELDLSGSITLSHAAAGAPVLVLYS